MPVARGRTGVNRAVRDAVAGALLAIWPGPRGTGLEPAGRARWWSRKV